MAGILTRASALLIPTWLGPSSQAPAGTLHRTISSALCTARSAPCRDFDISINAAGIAPLLRSQRQLKYLNLLYFFICHI
jgi:hypothetical protein